MTNSGSPWANMDESSQRRVDSDSSHNLFWITDLQGNYGFCIQVADTIIFTDNKIKLKGISIIKRKAKKNTIELFLILNKKEEWEIFLSLCEDLVAVTKRYDTSEKMLTAVENRLKRWQQLLKQDLNQVFTIEKQMGLFSELLCLKEVAAHKVGLNQAIVSWVGPEFDKQDFLLDGAVVEVKSHRTSKGEIAHISSLQQLHSEKEPLYLMSYALTVSENGLNVEDISHSIRTLLMAGSNEILDLFENKLMQYGYIPEIIKEPLQQFILDKTKLFKISDSFPKIVPMDVKNQIVHVQYSIDLSLCSEFEIEVETFLQEGGN
ncbi:hypothetical protein AWU65_14595 [Paenibacillus glucanolyticus]|uniref:PD-(D/E)XK motif protein n=1 Tax=Paenibacillus glucanolyticus TaxID=59843 RepID=A0A163K932_9BACL|nr:PD-(D/E)XK motif protein [Paenibacillus glucanolyticus]KZS47066.1 hypothetical protein AWU65_14595 [Paenibacillus glucanolyticus]